MLREVGVVLGGLAQDLADLPQLQLAVLAGVSPVKQLRRVAERLLLRSDNSLRAPNGCQAEAAAQTCGEQSCVGAYLHVMRHRCHIRDLHGA